MSHARARPLLAAAALAALLGSTPGALARGAMGFDQNTCVVKVGPDFMYFTGYQPTQENKKFCEDIPATGQAIFVFDFAQEEMREMKTDFRIIRDTGADEAGPLDALTVAYLPPQVYPKGSLSLSHVFSETGNFIGIVKVDGSGDQHWTARFPFTVGRAFSPRLPYYLLTAAAALAMLLLFWGRDQTPEKPKR
jgi:hypothetical protein